MLEPAALACRPSRQRSRRSLQTGRFQSLQKKSAVNERKRDAAGCMLSAVRAGKSTADRIPYGIPGYVATRNHLTFQDRYWMFGVRRGETSADRRA